MPPTVRTVSVGPSGAIASVSASDRGHSEIDAPVSIRNDVSVSPISSSATSEPLVGHAATVFSSSASTNKTETLCVVPVARAGSLPPSRRSSQRLSLCTISRYVFDASTNKATPRLGVRTIAREVT